MAAKNDEERIDQLAEKIKQLEARKKDLLARTKAKQRKERTRRLIQIGAIIESIGINTPELAEKFKIQFNKPKVKEWIETFLKDNIENKQVENAE